MTTVFFYNFILISSTVFVWFSEKGRTRLDRWMILIIAFLLVFIPSAIRYDIGVDYLSYLDIFESGNYVNYKLNEPAFYFINYLLDILNSHFCWVFIVFSFIYTSVTFAAYPKNNAWLLHFLFFSMLWFFSFNGVRQAIALSWCLLALFHFFDKRHLKFFILIIIGSFFHQSALVIAIIAALSLIPLPIFFKKYVAPILFIVTLCITFFFTNYVLVYMELLLNLLGLGRYAGYFHSVGHFIARDFGSGLGAMGKILFSVYMIFNAKYYIEQNRQFWLLLVLMFFYALGVILANKIVIFGRMADTFVVAQILGAYLLWSFPKNRAINRLVVGFFLLFLLLTFSKVGFGIPTSYSDPKLNPYQTIFDGEQ